MKNEFINYKGRDNKDYLAWKDGNMWYYKEKGKNKVEAVPFEYEIENGKTRFYKSNGKPYSFSAVNYNNWHNKSTVKSNSITKTKSNNSISTIGINQDTLKKERNNKYKVKIYNPTPKLHYTRNYKQRVSELGLNNRDAVRKFQQELLGFNNLNDADGIWGDNTERAYLALYGNINKKDYTDPVQLGINTNANLTNTFAVANPKITSTRFNTNNLNLNTVPTFQDIINRPLSQLTFAKNGAKLVSKNPIERFKSFKKC